MYIIQTVKKSVWKLGLVFESVNEFRAVVTKYAIVEHVTIKKCVNELIRVRVRCINGYPCLLYANIDS